MRKDLLAIGLGLVLSSVTVFSSLAAGPATVTLSGHVPAPVARGQSQMQGRVGADTAMDLSIGLALRNREDLTNLIAQLYDPKSPNFGKYLTPEQFTQRFGPTEEDYQAAIEFAHQHGLTVTRQHANRMLLNVSGRAEDVEKTFGVTLHQYQHPTEARQFFAPDRDPSVPASLRIQDLSGLDNYRRPRTHYHVKPSSAVSATQGVTGKAGTDGGGAKVGSGPFNNYVGDDFRKAYVPGTALNGSGQTIALVQFDGYLPSDIVAYENLTGRTNIPLQNVLIDGFSGIPTGTGGEVEVSLDIEMCVCMAPALSKIILYEGDPFFNFHPNDVLNQIAVDNAARQVSCSWGWIGGPNLTTDQIFQQMAAQGQTFFDASGDGDAFLPGEVDSPFGFGEPSSNPYITQVGGTTLAMNGLGASYASETVWNWGVRFGDDGVGSSGGISSFYSIPSWQTNINMAQRGGSQVFRNIPDVALTADDVLVIADGGLEFFGTGGTSCAAPLWAGFTALVNQQAVINGRPPVGFINPALYSIAASANYTNCFHDVTTGNNEWSQSPTLFSAAVNYDLCTGLGTPNGTNLINALVSANSGPIHISPPPPPYGSTLSAVNGSNPNGQWSLFIQDDAAAGAGIVSNGWILRLTTANLVGTAGDLELLMSTTNTSIFSGQSVTFVLTVTNYGPSISTNASVVDDLPLSVTISSTNTTQGTVTRSGTTLIWNIGTLAVGSGARMLLTVQPHSVGSLVNTANANSGTVDPNPDDDTATVSVNVISPTFLLVPSTAGVGQPLQIVMTNPAFAGLSMVIQASTNLANTNWVNISTSTVPFTFTDPNAGSFPRRFYRAQLLP